MEQTTYKTMDECFKRELFADIDHAETIGVISADCAAFLNNSAEGVQFINPKPEEL